MDACIHAELILTCAYDIQAFSRCGAVSNSTSKQFLAESKLCFRAFSNALLLILVRRARWPKVIRRRVGLAAGWQLWSIACDAVGGNTAERNASTPLPQFDHSKVVNSAKQGSYC
jgi:hypothetical protein